MKAGAPVGATEHTARRALCRPSGAPDVFSRPVLSRGLRPWLRIRRRSAARNRWAARPACPLVKGEMMSRRPLAVLALAGCDGKPRAPALTTEAVYTSDAIGLTFVAPEGWVLFAKATPPPGKYDRPLRMVAYQQAAGDSRTNFELYAIDLPDGQGLMSY